MLPSGQLGKALYKARMTDLMSISVAGCAGRMGRQLVAAAHKAGHKVAGGTEVAGSAALGQDLGTLAGFSALGVKATEKLRRKSTRLNSSHVRTSRMPSSA